MLDAAVATIDLHGKETVGDLLPVFEDFLDNAPEDSSLDIVRQSVVILMGSLARHLDKDDPKVRPIIGKLIQALATPSQQVEIGFFCNHCSLNFSTGSRSCGQLPAPPHPKHQG